MIGKIQPRDPAEIFLRDEVDADLSVGRRAIRVLVGDGGAGSRQ